ncbi:MAG: GvpL/GvpF family gas vesicle protein [Candidatus Hatepunaea meridiana]|nr:GvpL/GvpF family gas vesicle protein [Candidatus Hatepunaea meridiana]
MSEEKSIFINQAMTPSDREVVYLYCLTGSNINRAFNVLGINSRNPVFMHGYNGIEAAISMVPFNEFCGADAETKMQDLAWVGPRACRHEEIIEYIMDQAPVFPVSFGTLFTSISKLENTISANHEAIIEFLDWMNDKEEWSVKALIEMKKVKHRLFSQILKKNSARLSTLTKGVRYFEEQRLRNGIDRELKLWINDAIGCILKTMNDCTIDFKERRVIDCSNDDNEMKVIRNWAFLIKRNFISAFNEIVAGINTEYKSRGLELELSGPWPPYSFVPSITRESQP